MNYILLKIKEFRLSGHVITILLLAACFSPAILSVLYPVSLFSNPALAASELNTTILIANQTEDQASMAAPALSTKSKYGRLPERFIVNRGRADEKIVICLEGEKKAKPDIIDEVVAAKDKPKEYPHLVPLENESADKVAVVKAATPPPSLCEPNIIGGFMTTVIGPGELSFSWKVSCDPLGACLRVDAGWRAAFQNIRRN